MKLRFRLLAAAALCALPSTVPAQTQPYDILGNQQSPVLPIRSTLTDTSWRVASQSPDFTTPLGDRIDDFMRSATPPAAGHWSWGLGLMTTDIPIAASRLTAFMTQIFYERNLNNTDASYRFALGGGFYGLGGLLPVPVLRPAFYFGSEKSPIMGRVTVGGFYDLLVGGHAGVSLTAGMVVRNRFDFSIILVPWGTQPVRPYQEFFGKTEEEFIDTSDVAYPFDPDDKPLPLYDRKHFRDDDPRFNANDAMLYYSSYDRDYGISGLNNPKAFPGDFDYVKPREYISYPYFGFMLTFRY
jgi:hypothetical protein